ncbi:hypothetical protein ACE6H2_015935 [Prunus campanulata]
MAASLPESGNTLLLVKDLSFVMQTCRKCNGINLLLISYCDNSSCLPITM